MKLKWQWFLGGRIMFWTSITLFCILIIGFLITYVIDPLTFFHMEIQKIDESSIKNISENYVKKLNVVIDKPVVYRFVRFKQDKGYKAAPDETVLLGTFHEWNGKYYIDISVDLYKLYSLNEVVIHETRHMLVEYLKDKKIINLDKYSEEIALNNDSCWNNLFNDAIYVLRKSQ